MFSIENGYKRSLENDRKWSRELGDTEYPMVLAIGGEEAKKEGKRRENLLIHSLAYFHSRTISIDTLSHHFKSAWIALRLFNSPDLATEYKGKEKIYKSPLNAKELEDWQNQTLEIINIGQQNPKSVQTTVAQAIKQRQNRINGLPSCTVILGQNGKFLQGVVILFISHWRIEAGGALALIDRLMDFTVGMVRDGDESAHTKDLLAYKYDQIEINKLTPSVEDALMPNRTASSESKKRVANRIKKMSDKLSRNMHIAITGNGKEAERKPFKINERIYSATCTSSMAERCKGANISVTSAIHAAYLCALYAHVNKVSAESRKENLSYASIMPAQVRTRIQNGTSYLRKQGCWNAALMLFLALDLIPKQNGELDLMSLAKSLKDQYQTANQTEWLNEDARQTSEQLIEFFTKTIGNAPVDPSNVAIPYFTSLGILDKEVINKVQGDEKINIQVNRVSAWADSVAPGIVMRVWTFDGRLNIQIASNEAWHLEEQIEEILNDMQVKLSKTFDLPFNAEEVIVESY